jgi:Rod binding protein
MKPVPNIARTQLYGPATLEGRIGRNSPGQVKKQATNLASSNGSVSSVNVQVGTETKSAVRSDFLKHLETEIDRQLGPDGSTIRSMATQGMQSLIEPTTGKLDLNRLDDEAERELKRLQTAAEGFEANMMKNVLSQLRKSSFQEKQSPTTEMARDLLDQQAAESAAKGARGLGIATLVFSSAGEQVVRKAAARQGSVTPAAPAPETNS